MLSVKVVLVNVTQKWTNARKIKIKSSLIKQISRVLGDHAATFQGRSTHADYTSALMHERLTSTVMFMWLLAWELTRSFCLTLNAFVRHLLMPSRLRRITGGNRGPMALGTEGACVWYYTTFVRLWEKEKEQTETKTTASILREKKKSKHGKC